MQFSVGDMVTWASEHYAKITRGKETIGDGPFRVKAVKKNVGIVEPADTQLISLEVSNPLIEYYSGSFFKLAE